MFKDTIVNIDGNITEPQHAKISIFDRGFLFGDSVYEATLCRQSKALFLKEHIDRLFRSADMLSMKISYSKEQIAQEVQKTINALKLEQGLVRFIVSRGVEELGLLPGAHLKSSLVVIYMKLAGYPERWYQQGTKIKISSVKRNHPACLPPMAKTGNYLNNILAGIEATSAGYEDALMINLNDNISEGTTNNFWFVKNGELYTPNIASGILDGITRKAIFEIAADKGIKVHDTEIPRATLKTFEECFLTSSTKGVVPVSVIEPDWKSSFIPGPVTKVLMEAYEGKISEFFLR